jgi:D-alanyl-D-alanine carboxypeptidase
MDSKYSAGGGLGVLAFAVVFGIFRIMARQELNHQIEQEDLTGYSIQFKTEAHTLMDQSKEASVANYLHWDVNAWHDQAFEESQYEAQAGHGRRKTTVTKVDHDQYFANLFTHMLEQADADRNTKAAKALESLAASIGLQPEG